MRTLARELSPPAPGARSGRRCRGIAPHAKGGTSGPRTGVMAQAMTPPLVVALDAAVLHGDPAMPLPPTPALVACCWGTAAHGALPTSTRASRQPGRPGWRYAVTGRWPWGLGTSQAGACLSRVQRRTETYGLVRRGWEHDYAAPDFAVTSLACRTWTGTPSEKAGTRPSARGKEFWSAAR